ncbi:Cation-independent mannose-6-phosphate receptor [Dissostichus eleginoides]|uniref:Cation-independent mannose-6-phosphate receptor n=1 Tax=Dissostichus eleginoides TaxID=100907 RepID=A0AAD9CGZ9_DISEL|nr:Cation-independent mannose-6-phosphate receptor [Dissostichus eleginoides]
MGRLVRTVMDASALCHPPPNPLLLVGDRNASITVSCLRRAAWGVRRAPHSASTHSASERTGLDATGLTRAGGSAIDKAIVGAFLAAGAAARSNDSEAQGRFDYTYQTLLSTVCGERRADGHRCLAPPLFDAHEWLAELIGQRAAGVGDVPRRCVIILRELGSRRLISVGEEHIRGSLFRKERKAPPLVPNTGQCRQMGCLGICPGDEAERDGSRPVEEETACALSQYGGKMWAVCVVTVTHHCGFT